MYALGNSRVPSPGDILTCLLIIILYWLRMPVCVKSGLGAWPFMWSSDSLRPHCVVLVWYLCVGNTSIKFQNVK